jgi:hypothetical protein
MPSNVTVVPLIRLVSRIVELAGAEMLSRIMLVQDSCMRLRVWMAYLSNT